MRSIVCTVLKASGFGVSTAARTSLTVPFPLDQSTSMTRCSTSVRPCDLGRGTGTSDVSPKTLGHHTPEGGPCPVLSVLGHHSGRHREHFMCLPYGRRLGVVLDRH